MPDENSSNVVVALTIVSPLEGAGRVAQVEDLVVLHKSANQTLS